MHDRQRLTRREMDVLHLAAEGLTDRDIGAKLFISQRTVQVHMGHMFTKAGVNTRTALVRWAVLDGHLDNALPADVDLVRQAVTVWFTNLPATDRPTAALRLFQFLVLEEDE